MPWSPQDAERFKRGITGAKAKRKWAHVANQVLAKTGKESAAIRAANGVTRDAVVRRLKKRNITGS